MMHTATYLQERLAWLLFLLLLLSTVGYGHDGASEVRGPPSGDGVSLLDASLPWHGENRARLEEMLRAHGRRGPSFDPKGPPPIAVLDCDNTLLKNDIGRATFYWAVRSDALLQPRGGDWRHINPYLTAEAIQELARGCAGPAPGQPLVTSKNAACAKAILLIAKGRLASGAAAFAGYDHRRVKPTAAWTTQVFAGHTPAELRRMATMAIEEGLRHPVGRTQSIAGVSGLPGYLRVYPQMRDLIAALEREGIQPWIVSASAQEIVEVFAQRVGVPTERVIGVRQEVEGGKLTPRLTGCGSVPTGTDAMMTYKLGKRCWINQEIFGVTGAAALRAHPQKRAVFGAGDSSTDEVFLLDVRGVRLVIDRHEEDVMCHALGGRAEGWLINPMFVAPMSPREALYPCATTACWDAEGEPRPCLRPDGVVIPDQRDPAAP